MFGSQLVSGPICEPVTLALAKQFCAVDVGWTDDDCLISSFISAARQAAEKYMNRAIYDQVWKLSLDYFPIFWFDHSSRNVSSTSYPYLAFFEGMMIRLPMGTCSSVTSINYTDQSGTPQILDPSLYGVDCNSEPARVYAVNNQWPTAQIFAPGNVQITYVAGSWGDGVTIANCPANVQTAICVLAAFFYSQREGGVIPAAFYVLLDSYRIVTFGLGY